MIRRLINGAWTIFVYACMATLIAQVIMLSYLISTWKIDKQRWLHVVAAAQGIETAAGKEPPAQKAEEKTAEQPSFEQILETRAMKYRNLEIREQELRNTVSQLQYQESKLVDEKKRYRQVHDDFEAQLSAMRQGSATAGKDEVRRTLESIKPKQAKELILEMLDNKEIDDVVTLLTPMPDTKRTKSSANSRRPRNWKNSAKCCAASAKARHPLKYRKTRVKNWGKQNLRSYSRHGNDKYRSYSITGIASVGHAPGGRGRR